MLKRSVELTTTYITYVVLGCSNYYIFKGGSGEKL